MRHLQLFNVIIKQVFHKWTSIIQKLKTTVFDPMQNFMLNQPYSMYDFGWCHLEMMLESCLYLPEGWICLNQAWALLGIWINDRLVASMDHKHALCSSVIYQTFDFVHNGRKCFIWDKERKSLFHTSVPLTTVYSAPRVTNVGPFKASPANINTNT